MKENNKKKKIIIICVAIALIIITALILFLYNRSKISATTMRILRIEGEVTLTDNGKDKTIKDNLRLNSGNALSTAVESLVSIGLDDVKIITLDQLSRAIFNQNGRKLDLELTAGSLFFEVQKPLEDEESMDIRTSTMIVGIRGTSGWVSVDGEHEQLIVTDGHVHVIGTNSVTGEKKEIDVSAGERITVYLYNDRKVDSIEFKLEKVTERDLPEFLLERLRENRTLLDKVCRETGWDKPWILGISEEEMPKVIDDTNRSDDEDTPPEVSDEEPLLPDTGEEVSENTEDTDTGVLTKEQLQWAHSHIALIDPSTGIRALNDMTLFDPAFYARTNPDVVAKYGTHPDALLYHYLTRGKKEGRPPIAPATPTPTFAPTSGPSNKYDDDDDDDDDSDDSTQVSSTQQTTNTAQYSGGPAYFGGFDGKGARANLYKDGNHPDGLIELTAGDTGNPTTATIPNSVSVKSANPSSFSPDLDPPNISFGNGASGINTLDLSTSTPTTGGDVWADGMINFMNNNSQLNKIIGPSSTITKNANGNIEAEIKTGGYWSQSISDAISYINKMVSGGTGSSVSKLTMPKADSTSPDLTINYDSTNGRTADLKGNTYTNITVNGTSAPYTLTGEKGGSTVTLGTIDNDGFTIDSNL